MVVPRFTTRDNRQFWPNLIIMVLYMYIAPGYIKFVELESLVLHTKFQDHRTSGSGDLKVFTIYGRDDLGHVNGQFI